MKSNVAIKTKFRCAIYTRVSSDAGLEQEFNSLDNQREAAEAYIKSQAHEGWSLVSNHYDDGGFSGGSMERPALLALLNDIRARRIDVIVVYKVDRLTRSLADFAKLVELFDENAVSFVSVTQAFNTTNSMGRLTLNVLLSFAQFEREVTGERIRDKIAASKRKGIWMGGVVPLGYRVENRKLLIEPAEADQVRHIFRRYLQLKSVPALAAEMRQQGLVSRVRKLASGKIIGGVPLTNGPLAVIITNRIYIGEITHKGQSYSGEHEPVIDRQLFDDVQAMLKANNRVNSERRQSSGAILIGKIFDDRGNRMTPAHANKGPLRYNYYVSSPVIQGRKAEAGSIARVSAPEVEGLVLEVLRERGAAYAGTAGLTNRLSDTESPEDDEDAGARFIERFIERITVGKKVIKITLVSDDESPSVEVSVAMPPRHRKRRYLVESDQNTQTVVEVIRPEARARLLYAVVRARTWVEKLLDGRFKTVADIASDEGCSVRSVRMTLPLAFVSPDIIRAAIEGTLPHGTGVTGLSEASMVWQQRPWVPGNRSKVTAQSV